MGDDEDAIEQQSLLDHFAGLAMAAMMSSPAMMAEIQAEADHEEMPRWEALAMQAYIMAEMMVDERADRIREGSKTYSLPKSPLKES